MAERRIQEYPGHPEITEKMKTGGERIPGYKGPGPGRFREFGDDGFGDYGFGSLGEDVQIAPAPITTVPPYAPTPLESVVNWFKGSSVLVKLGLLTGAGFMAYHFWGGKKW